MNRKLAGAALVLALFFTACAKGNTGAWGRSGVSEASVKRQTAYCRSQADEYVDRDRAAQPGDRDLIRPQDGQTVQGAFTRMDLQRTYDRVFRNCMQAAGYSQQPD